MAEEKKEIKQEKPKGPLGKLKEKMADDAEDHLAILSTFSIAFLDLLA